MPTILLAAIKKRREKSRFSAERFSNAVKGGETIQLAIIINRLKELNLNLICHSTTVAFLGGDNKFIPVRREQCRLLLLAQFFACNLLIPEIFILNLICCAPILLDFPECVAVPMLQHYMVENHNQSSEYAKNSQ